MSRAERPDIDAGAIAAAVAFYLPGWTLKPREPDDGYSGNRHERATLVDPNGRELDFYGNRYEGRLSVSGNFNQPYRPYDMYGTNDVNKPVTSMQFNPTRPAQKIAADILAKVIPGCDVAWALAAEKKARDDANKAKARANVRLLAKLSGVADPTAPGSYAMQRVNAYTSTEDWHVGDFRLTSSDPNRVEIRQIYCTFDQALQIAAILRRPSKEKANGQTRRRPAAATR